MLVFKWIGSCCNGFSLIFYPVTGKLFSSKIDENGKDFASFSKKEISLNCH
jgi:hypothetical protein